MTVPGGAQGRASDTRLQVQHTDVRPGDYLLDSDGCVLDVQPCDDMTS